MLKLHHAHHLPLPHLLHSARRMELSPVQSESDELIEAIGTVREDDVLHLENTPDVVGLEEFWSHVEDDLKKDPDWYNFAED